MGKITVNIAGKEYRIVSDESGDVYKRQSMFRITFPRWRPSLSASRRRIPRQKWCLSGLARPRSCLLYTSRHLYEQYALGEIDLETYRTRKAVYDTELVQAKNVHAVITAQTKQIKSDYEIKLKQQEIMQEVGNANMLTKALIDRLINKVYVFPGERIEIEYATQDFLETKESEKEV